MQDDAVLLFDMVMGISEAIDLVSPVLVNHHLQVAYIALSLSDALGYDADMRQDIWTAAALHDIGALSLKERLDTFEFEYEKPAFHANVGYFLLRNFDPLAHSANLIHYHHIPWDYGKYSLINGDIVPVEAHILHLADRIAVLIQKEQEPLCQRPRIINAISEHVGTRFLPDLVAIFQEISQRDHFWYDVASPSISRIITQKTHFQQIPMNLINLITITRMLSRVIDFRSQFTATHSSGVAVVSEYLARHCGFSDEDILRIKIAGYLHDVGKLAIPSEILEKQGTLNNLEKNILRMHVYNTFQILQNIGFPGDITSWASYHHEKLNGAGYPFQMKGDEISLGARIVAVADIFTATSENRPYRIGMEASDVLSSLDRLVNNGALDAEVVSVLKSHFIEINDMRIEEQLQEGMEYNEFLQLSNTSVSQ